MPQFQFRHVLLPRDVSVNVARQLLTEYAEKGQWELARVRKYPDGTRRVVLRRRIIPAVRTF